MTTTVSPLQIQSYHAEFLRQGHYLRGWSDRTLRTYRQGLRTLGDTPITKAGLAAWMVAQQQRGLTRGGINMYAQTINSYLSWLHAEGHLDQPLRIRLLPNPPSVLTVLADRDVQRIATYRPQGVIPLRTWALIPLASNLRQHSPSYAARVRCRRRLASRIGIGSFEAATARPTRPSTGS